MRMNIATDFSKKYECFYYLEKKYECNSLFNIRLLTELYLTKQDDKRKITLQIDPNITQTDKPE